MGQVKIWKGRLYIKALQLMDSLAHHNITSTQEHLKSHTFDLRVYVHKSEAFCFTQISVKFVN